MFETLRYSVFIFRLIFGLLPVVIELFARIYSFSEI